jgi:hypothetical protein
LRPISQRDYVIDIDVNKKGDKRHRQDCRYLEEIIGRAMPDTLTVETMSGGRHYYYLSDDETLTSNANSFDKSLSVDVRANGGYVIAPDNESYCIDDLNADEVFQDIKAHITPLPDWLSVKMPKKQSPKHTTTPADGELFAAPAKKKRPASDYDLSQIAKALENLTQEAVDNRDT